MVKVNYICVIMVTFAMMDIILSKPICLIIRDVQIPLPSFEKISKRDVSKTEDLSSNRTESNNNLNSTERNLTEDVIILIPEYNVYTDDAIKCDYREEESYRN